MNSTLALELLPLWLAVAAVVWRIFRWGLHVSRTLDRINDVLAPADGPSMRITLTDHERRLLRVERLAQ